MAKVHPEITAELREWIEAQHLFCVASAPLDGAGHVNVSPKGHACLRVLDEKTVAYLDLTGSYRPLERTRTVIPDDTGCTSDCGQPCGTGANIV